MFTASGAGASFIAPPQSRLRPRTPAKNQPPQGVAPPPPPPGISAVATGSAQEKTTAAVPLSSSEAHYHFQDLQSEHPALESLAFEQHLSEQHHGASKKKRKGASSSISGSSGSGSSRGTVKTAQSIASTTPQNHAALKPSGVGHLQPHHNTHRRVHSNGTESTGAASNAASAFRTPPIDSASEPETPSSPTSFLSFASVSSGSTLRANRYLDDPEPLALSAPGSLKPGSAPRRTSSERGPNPRDRSSRLQQLPQELQSPGQLASRESGSLVYGKSGSTESPEHPESPRGSPPARGEAGVPLERGDQASSDLPSDLMYLQKAPNVPTFDVNIVVVGEAKVGKSAFIMRAHELIAPPKSPSSVKSMTIDKASFQVRLNEVDSKIINTSTRSWPQSFGYADGALILFDVTQAGSLQKVALLHDLCDDSSLPHILVACKCDAPQGRFQLVPHEIENYARGLGINRFVETSASLIEGTEKWRGSQKAALISLLTGIVQSKKATSQQRYNNPGGVTISTGISAMMATGGATNRRRANSNNPIDLLQRPDTASSKHGRSSSEYQATYLRSDQSGTHARRTTVPKSPVSPGGGAQFAQDLNTVRNIQGGNYPNRQNLEVVSTSPFSVPQQGKSARSPSIASESQTSLLSKKSSKFARESRDATRDSFLDPEADEYDDEDEDDMPLLSRDSDASSIEDEELKSGPKTVAYSFDELVDKLVAPTVTKQDVNFRPVFFCFYRKFAAPRDLLRAILERFETVRTDPRMPELGRSAALVQWVSALQDWVTGYPGDFAHPKTYGRAISFLGKLSSERLFQVSAQTMLAALTPQSEDEDASWARTDYDTTPSTAGNSNDSDTSSLKSFLTTSTYDTSATPRPRSSYAPSEISSSGTVTDLAGLTLSSSTPDAGVAGSFGPDLHRRPSETPSFSSSSQLAPTLSHASDSIPHSPLLGNTSKDSYLTFISLPDALIADSLTRLDYSLFSLLTPRSLPRHTATSPLLRTSHASLAHVTRLIAHFNHIAYWVACTILSLPKPKHRSKCLEKFMNVAWILRHRNNYNSLGAVIAGVNGIAVHRLWITRQGVAREVARNFMRLEVLMGTHKSHFSYRLAWENTRGERIPFIPLHRRDLVSADEGNRTFVAGEDGDKEEKINWSKFQVMGEVVMVVLNAQRESERVLGAPGQVGGAGSVVERMVAEATAGWDDDHLTAGFEELYERSVQLEPPAAIQVAQAAAQQAAAAGGVAGGPGGGGAVGGGSASVAGDLGRGERSGSGKTKKGWFNRV